MGTMKIVYCGYRDWALKIYKNLSKNIDNIILLKTNEELNIIYEINPDLVFFIGWSTIIKNDIIKKYKCICLHPSPLPNYRGGSPLQHQIIYGEKTSAVSLFLMNEFIDGGDIIYQKKFNLDGELFEIFNRIIKIGTTGIKYIIKKYNKTKILDLNKQNLNNSKVYKRRLPDMSEILIQDFSNYTAEELYNKIRALQEPYPLPFIKCKDNTKLYIIKSKIE
jgi:methionyl-tRNA formyltransferase